MKMKTLLLGVACGFLLSACGGPIEEEAAPAPVEELGTVQGALCEGWDSGARRCSFKCTSTSTWWTTYSSVAYGDCTEFARRECGFTAYGTCWSK
ncbi:hypothetical protein BO221_46460 [Archangium sp. Cb G35]|uniref:hypothetical protein n=1 Tax=Archangium sp. Cb G35 TaxID=1920190 RepID=UPI0009378D3B|nr:hypothetical protein [Archangium sp. Cb G35]OJT17171.1 hypothetical protein BO221_46460 [Archangium sp. Cb G35]WNG61696.1 hypothetical protein F0U59_48505 [Archangium gephyra]